MTTQTVRCKRCSWTHSYTPYPSSHALRLLGRTIREHYELCHPGIEVNR